MNKNKTKIEKSFRKDENSVLYKLRLEQKEIFALQAKQTQEIENLLNRYVTFHQVLVENTTEKEWNNITSSIKFQL